MSERRTPQLSQRAQVIRDHPIHNQLDAFRVSFTSACDQQGIARSALSQLPRQDLQRLALELLISLCSLPVVRMLPSSDGQGTLANDILGLITSVSSDMSAAESLAPLLSSVLDNCSTDESIWDRVYSVHPSALQVPPKSRYSEKSQAAEPRTGRARLLRPSHVPSHGPPRVTRRGEKRYKVGIACDNCRRRKVKCDGVRPACGPCLKRKSARPICQYGSTNDEFSLVEGDGTQTNALIRPDIMPNGELLDPGNHDSSPFPLPKLGNAPLAGSGHSEASSVRNSIGIVETCQEHFHEYGISSMQAFYERLRASIDAQLGIPTATNPIMIPMTDAPMFLAPSSNLGPNGAAKNNLVLPSRKHADLLADLYWSRLHPIEPILDRKLFDCYYNALYSGTISDTVEHLFACIFNTMLALATQCQEHVDLDQRQEESKIYFNRAWYIIRPGQELWETPSLDLIECLLLMCTYLRCTSNYHQAWMTVGSAVRIAQSLGLHLPGSHPRDGSRDRRMRLWRVCIYIDKQMSLAQGRPRTIHDCFINPIFDVKDIPLEDEAISTPIHDIVTKSIELFQSITSIKSSSLKEYHGRLASSIEQLAQKDDEYLHMVLKLEDRLVDWEKDLPPSLKYTPGSAPSQKNGHLALGATFKLRIAHSRIFLFRPMLAYLCLSKFYHYPHAMFSQTMRQQIIHNCASVCIRNAQEIISILEDQCKPEVLNSFPIPWWHRMLYLHVAATTLIAATLSSHIATEFQTSASWDQLISLLHAHEHCSSYISQYTHAFQTLLSEVSSIRSGPTEAIPPMSDSLPPTPFLQEFFPGANNFPFGLEDIFYLENPQLDSL